uniref:Uncharacterized protein n=1 Tax=Rhizophagus irregularis (strain DAOM 181602 / DAOM 197198 / MUCL 43194) TaxID=747089 RepID=U9UWG4_RHIID
MSCSNVFLGDLPELSYDVINYSKNQLYTIFIEIYLHNLNDDFKTKLNEYKIINII